MLLKLRFKLIKNQFAVLAVQIVRFAHWDRLKPAFNQALGFSMFIAHLPAGYICGKNLQRMFAKAGAPVSIFMLAAIVGGIAPDLDMFYFYLIDSRQTHHHMYWPHYPTVWLALLAASGAWLYFAKQKSNAALACIFSISGCIHLLLDTVVGDVFWLAPISFQPFSFFTVPSVYKPWWLNFILHWSFLLELFIVFFAVFIFRRNRTAAG